MDILRQDLTLGPLYTTLLLGFSTVILLFWYTLSKQSYWKNVGIPYDKPVPFFGSMLDALKKPLQDSDVEKLHKYGRIYGFYEGNRAVLNVSEPEILRNILVKDFFTFTSKRTFETGNNVMDKSLSMIHGEDWKRIRTIVSPTFTTGKIKRMMTIFKDCSQTLIKNFKEASVRGEPVEAKSIYGAFTMDVIASSAFSTKIDSHNDPNNPFVAAARTLFLKEIDWKLLIFAFFPQFAKYFRVHFFSPKTLEFFGNVTLQIIEERAKTGQVRNDFLQLLIDTAKETAESGKLDQNENDDIADNYGKIDSEIFKNYHFKKTLSQDELVAQCTMFFFAGYETTASTLSFISYALALNPDVQEKLIQEVDEILSANDGELTYEAIHRMKYLDNVIAETLRLYPPLLRTERVADEDYKIHGTGLTIPKGMIVTIPIYAMHRDPELFPNPEKFDPDRFTPEERAKQVPYSYLPFSAGPRNCVGMRFALMEMKVCMAHVLSNFRIKKCSETKVPLDFYNGFGLLQPKATSLFFEVRKDTVKAL